MTPPAREKILIGLLAMTLLGLGGSETAQSLGRLYAGISGGADGIKAPGPLQPQIERAERLFRRGHDPQAAIRAGLLRLRLAISGSAAFPDREHLTLAAAELRSGLMRAPADPRGWIALSLAETLLGQNEAAHRSLAMSLAAARHDPELTLSWCRLGVTLWSRLDDTERERIADEVKNQWQRQRSSLLTIAALPHHALAIRQALSGLPDAQIQFDDELRHTLPRG